MKKLLRKISKDGDTNEILSKGFSFLLLRLIGLLAGYVFAYLVSRYYGAGVYGLVSLCFALFLFASIISRLGVDVNLVRYYALDENWTDKGMFFKVMAKSLIASLIIATILYLTRDFFILNLFNKPELEPYFVWMVMTIPLWVITLLCGGLLRAKKENKWFAFLNNPGRFILTVFALILLAWLYDNDLNAIKAHFYGVMILAIIALTKVLFVVHKITINSRKDSWKFMREAFPMMLSSTVLVLLGWMDTFVLGIYETDANIGIYNVSLKIAALTSFSLQSINSILAPKLAKSFQEDKKDIFNMLIRFATRLNFFLTLIVVILIVVFHNKILAIFGDEFLAGSLILIILCTGQLVNSLSGSVGVILQMTGNQKIYQNVVLIALALNLILNFVLTPIYGGLGAAIATVVSIASWNLAGAIYLKVKLRITSYYSFKK